MLKQKGAGEEIGRDHLWLGWFKKVSLQKIMTQCKKMETLFKTCLK